jgi:NitT/TauT family transport system permease protein
MKITVLRFVLIVSLLLWWEAAAGWLRVADPFFYSTPSRIGVAVARWLAQSFFWEHLLRTVLEVIVGYSTGAALGILTGFALAAHPRVDAVLQPLVTVANALPRITLGPLLILWLGLTFKAVVVLIVSVVFFVVFQNAYAGFKSVSPVVLRHARILGATTWQIHRYIYLPACLEWWFASLRVSAGFALAAGLLGEYLAGGGGIGSLIDTAQSQFDATGVMAGLAVVAALAYALDLLLRAAERRICRWRPASQTAEVSL